MTRLLCTDTLLQRLDTAGLAPPDEAEPPSRLGDWSATLLALRPARLVLAVSEHALLPTVIDADDAASVPERLPEAVYQLLLALDVPPDLARLERTAMQPLLPCPMPGSAPGAMHGPLNAFGVELHAAWERGLSRSPAELTLHLARLASEYLEGATPAQTARRRFHLTPDSTRSLGL